MRITDVINENINLKENRTYYVYVHTCPNEWSYVGLSTHPKQRWNNGEGYKENKPFYQAIKKFGWENIKHEIIAETNYGWAARMIERTVITHFAQLKRCYNGNNIERLELQKKSVRKIPLKKVGQYDQNTGELINEFNSIREAREFTDVTDYGIRASCSGRIKTSGGFIWKYI